MRSARNCSPAFDAASPAAGQSTGSRIRGQRCAREHKVSRWKGRVMAQEHVDVRLFCAEVWAWEA